MDCDITDFNLYYDNAYRVEIERLKDEIKDTNMFYKFKKVILNILQFRHPEIGIKKDIEIPLQRADYYISGQKLSFGKPLKLRILVDEGLDVYEYFLNWLFTINPMENVLDVNSDNVREDTYCNIKLYTLKNNGGYRKKYFYYTDCYIKSVSGLDFKTTSDDKKELYIDVEFGYNKFSMGREK